MNNTQKNQEILVEVSGPFEILFPSNTRPDDILGLHRKGKLFMVNENGRYHFPKKETECRVLKCGRQIIKISDGVESSFGLNTSGSVFKDGKRVW